MNNQTVCYLKKSDYPAGGSLEIDHERPMDENTGVTLLLIILFFAFVLITSL